MDIKKRLHNKTFVVTMVTLLISFVYQVFGALGFVPQITEDYITNVIMGLINLLSMLGVLVDPTTTGITDTEKEEW